VFVASNEIFFTRALTLVNDVRGRNTHFLSDKIFTIMAAKKKAAKKKVAKKAAKKKKA